MNRPSKDLLPYRVIVCCGVPRSGTSLTVEIVRRCGYKLISKGNRFEDVGSGRNGYNEHDYSSKRPSIDIWNAMSKNGDRLCMKFGYFKEWVNFFKKNNISFYIVSPIRGRDANILSAKEHIHVNDKKIDEYRESLRKFLLENRDKYFAMRFENLIKGDEKTKRIISKLVNRIGSVNSVDYIMEAIKPEYSIYK